MKKLLIWVFVVAMFAIFSTIGMAESLIFSDSFSNGFGSNWTTGTNTDINSSAEVSVQEGRVVWTQGYDYIESTESFDGPFRIEIDLERTLGSNACHDFVIELAESEGFAGALRLQYGGIREDTINLGNAPSLTVYNSASTGVCVEDETGYMATMDTVSPHQGTAVLTYQDNKVKFAFQNYNDETIETPWKQADSLSSQKIRIWAKSNHRFVDAVRVYSLDQEVPAASTLVSPFSTITDSSPVFTWTAVSNATWYQLWVNDSTDNKIKKWYTAAEANCDSGTGNCSVTTTSGTLNSGEHTWWIQTYNDNGFGEWSNGMDFSVSSSGSSSLPSAATLVSPDSSVSSPITYTWNTVSNSTWYQLWVDDSTGTKIQAWYTAAQADCETGSTCSITNSTTLTGSSTWWVQTYNGNGYGEWSNGMSFTASGGDTPGAATLTSPLGSITDTTPTYTWNAVSDATWYQLWVGDSTGTAIQTWYTAAQAGCESGTGTCSITPATVLESGNGTWWVQTYNDNGFGEWSSGLSFTITGSQNVDNYTGYWHGTWHSTYGVSGSVSANMTYVSQDLYSGTMDAGNTDCGDVYNVPIIGSVNNNVITINGSYNCYGDIATLEFTQGTVSGNTMTGTYRQLLNGGYYDSGTFSLFR